MNNHHMVQGNQMTGPYGVPMYPGYGSRGYQGAGKASGGDIGYGSQSNQASNDRSQQQTNNQQKKETKQERPKDMPAMLSYDKPLEVTVPLPTQTGEAPPPECDDGYITDCADDDCCPESWIGDGFEDCEDQAYGCDLTCYDNDGGDCPEACENYTCWDGSCVDDMADCPDEPDVPEPEGVRSVMASAE